MLGPLNDNFAVSSTTVHYNYLPATKYMTNCNISSCLHRASIVSKTFFIVPTDAHYYKIIEMLKQFTNLKL